MNEPIRAGGRGEGANSLESHAGVFALIKCLLFIGMEVV